MNNRKQLEVYINQMHVGTLAETKDYLMAFEYSDEWVRTGISITPASIPLHKGVFADSLPDGLGPWNIALQAK